MNKKACMLAAFGLRLKDGYPALTVTMGTKIMILEILIIRFLQAIYRRAAICGVELVIAAHYSKHFDFFLLLAKFHRDLSLCLI